MNSTINRVAIKIKNMVKDEELSNDEKCEKILNKILRISRLIRADYPRDYIVTSHFQSNLSWSNPFRLKILKQIRNFANNEPIIECGAGRGLLSLLLKIEGCLIFPQDDGSWYRRNETFVKIFIEDFTSLMDNLPFNVLLLSWPPYNKSFAYDTLRNFKGNKLISITEGKGGACANDDYFELLEREWIEIKMLDDNSLPGITQFIVLYERRDFIRNKYTKYVERIKSGEIEDTILSDLYSGETTMKELQKSFPFEPVDSFLEIVEEIIDEI